MVVGWSICIRVEYFVLVCCVLFLIKKEKRERGKGGR